MPRHHQQAEKVKRLQCPGDRMFLRHHHQQEGGYRLVYPGGRMFLRHHCQVESPQEQFAPRTLLGLVQKCLRG